MSGRRKLDPLGLAWDIEDQARRAHGQALALEDAAGGGDIQKTMLLAALVAERARLARGMALRIAEDASKALAAKALAAKEGRPYREVLALAHEAAGETAGRQLRELREARAGREGGGS